MRTLVMLVIALQPGWVSARSCERGVADRHVAALRKAYAGFANPESSLKAVRAFFDALPESFGCYQAIFDYPAGPLYEEPVMDEVFPKLKAVVPETTYVRKLVRLSVGATWNADQINYLHHAARVALADSPSAFVRELDALTPIQEAGVWNFVFGGPHPSNEALPIDLQKRICSLSSRSCKSSADAYARALVRERREH